MAPITAAEKQKALLQQEIAKLSGAISRHAHPTYQPYPPRGRIPSRTSFLRGRGGKRGRGGSYGLDLRAVNKAKPADVFTPGPSVLGPASTNATSSSTPKEVGEISPPPPLGLSSEIPVKTEHMNEEAWVKKTSKGGNLSLMTKEKSAHLKASKPTSRKRARIPPSIQVLTSTSTSTGEGKRVVIDGVIFQFEQGGKKLTRIGDVNTSPVAGSSSGTPTRQSVDYGGERFKRTKRGNLVSRSMSGAVRREEQAKKPCRYYTKTGRCERALTCPYQHIPDRLAICPKFLRSTCPFTSDTCPLSHKPSSHNTPSCQHFQQFSTCRNGSSCLYPHVKVADNAKICEAFSREGWCDKAEGTCEDLHGWECGEWRETGKCSRGKGCGLRHVLRVPKTVIPGDQDNIENMDGAKDEGELPVEGGFDDGGEFIGFGIGPESSVSDGSDSEESQDSLSQSENDEVEDQEIEVETQDVAAEDIQSGMTDSMDENDEAAVLDDLWSFSET